MVLRAVRPVPTFTHTPMFRATIFLLTLFTAVHTLARSLSATERRMVDQGMVLVTDVDSTIRVSLMYARPDNFCHAVLYTDLRHAFLHPKAARALKQAQEYLKEIDPTLSLIIFDACRPMSVQQQMWDRLKNTPQRDYVSNPASGGGLHNYGMAVDVSICSFSGDTITMGVPVDNMDSRSHIDHEEDLVERGLISEEALRNRRLLRQVMRRAGFTPIRTEWWHFNLVSRQVARRSYKYVE